LLSLFAPGGHVLGAGGKTARGSFGRGCVADFFFIWFGFFESEKWLLQLCNNVQ